MPTVKIRGKAIPYTLRQSRRAKRISIRCKAHEGFELVYPVSETESAALAFFHEKQTWVLKTWAQAQAKPNPARTYADGSKLLYRGERINLRLIAQGDKSNFEFRNDQLKIVLPKRYHANQSLLRQAIEAFYRQRAKSYLPPRLHELAQIHGFVYNKLRIKNQKTRWGSCSSMGNINLNLRLMMAPDRAIDYVIVHELCHLREMNHSPAYWSLVETCCPDYRHWIDWFKTNGDSLIL